MVITYSAVFRTADGVSITASNLYFERLCVVFNLAALYSHLAKAEYEETGDLPTARRYSQVSCMICP